MIARILAMMPLIVSVPAAADTKFYGVWEGEATEEGSEAPYPMSISIFQKGGRVFQHSIYGAPLECAGGGVLIEQTNGALHLSELIVKNREMCADGTIRVYLNGDADLIWEWFYIGGDYAARADLKRREE